MSAAQEMMPDQSKDHYRQFPVDYPKHTHTHIRKEKGTVAKFMKITTTR
jgi:hypothetical protein